MEMQGSGKTEGSHADHMNGDSGLQFGVPPLTDIAQRAADRPKASLSKKPASDTVPGGMLEQVGTVEWPP